MKRFLKNVWRRIVDNPKTSITGILGAIATLVAHFGFNFDAATQLQITAIAITIVGLMATDQTKEKE